MESVMSERRYERGDASADELQEVVDEILSHLTQPDSEAADAARTAGLEPAGLSEAVVEIREGEQGAEPVLTTIVIGIAVGAGTKVAETLWDEVLWPRLRRRLGVRALGMRKAAPGDDEA